MDRFFASLVTLSSAAFCGLWVYVTIAGLLGAVEAYWWGGKGWFLPVFGMLVLTLGAIPSAFMVQKLMKRAHAVPSFRRLSAIGLVQGLALTPSLGVVSLFTRLVLEAMGMEVRGLVELLAVVLNMTLAFFVSILTPVLVLIAFRKMSSFSE